MNNLNDDADFPDSLITSFLVKSYEDYREFIEFAIGKLSEQAGLKFCLWYLRRFESDFGEEIFDGLTLSEINDTKLIVSKLESAIENPRSLSPAFFKDSKTALEQFGPHDESDAIEITIEGFEFRSALWNTLEYGQNHNSSAVGEVSEAIVSCLDHKVEETNYNLLNMFTFPDLQNEIDLQKNYLNRLLNNQI